MSKAKKLDFPTEVIYFDCETTLTPITETSDRHDLRLVCATYRNYLSKTQEESVSFTKDHDFWNWVLSKTRSKRNLWLIAHNTDYDFRVLRGFMNMKQEGLYLHLLITDVGRFILKFSNDPPKSLHESDPESYPKAKNPFKITVIDSMNFFKMSLSKLGETIGIDKLEVDFESVSDADLFTYCQRDVLILQRAMETYWNFLRENRLGSFATTIAKQSLNAFRYRFMKHDIHIHCDKRAVSLERDSYYGGRTECFYIGKVDNKTTYKLDINSMYPFVMANNQFPTKFLGLSYSQDKHTRKYNLKRNLYIANVNVETDIPCIPYRHENRLCFPTGTFNVTLCSPELDLLDRNNIPYEILKIAFYEGRELFKPLVTEMYAMRQKFKQEGNNQYEKFTKILMNSLYGKFGQRSPEWVLTGMGDKLPNDYQQAIDYDTGERYAIKTVNGQTYELKGYVEGFEAFVAVASFVTSYARVLLWEYLQLAGRENCYYCDTDSLFVNDQGYSNLHTKLSSKELGLLKLEETTNHLEIRALKDYTFGENSYIKGVPSKSIPLSECSFKYLEWERFNGALHKDRIDEVVTTWREKSLSRGYAKGIVSESGIVEPLRFQAGNLLS